MTGKRKTPAAPTVTGRQKDIHVPPAKRPKRERVVKKVDQSTGLSWREETDLKKALYASLQESKRLSRGSEEEAGVVSPGGSRGGRLSSMSAPSRGLHGQYSADDSSQDSTRSTTSSSTHDSKKTTVHAQRKFAQGQSLPNTPSTTPVKVSATPVKMPCARRAKTEDFLTFLCLRGSSILPPHLDFFGYSRDDREAGGSSRQTTPRQPVHVGRGVTRESTPDLSSSSDSDMRDELPELASLVSKTQQTPTRKAARASASTPETARGLVSIRSGMGRKVGKVPAKALLKRSKTLLASPNKMSPRGKRALMRRQRSPHKANTGTSSGSDSKGSNSGASKPVRASATPSKKRITPQLLPIGALPKFYIEDSDSSNQSNVSREMFINRGGRTQLVITSSKSTKLKMKALHEKSKLKRDELFKNIGKADKNKASKKIAPKTKVKKVGVPNSNGKVSRTKDKVTLDVRKKRTAALAKNYAEDVDDDIESLEEFGISKPLKKTLSEKRRKIVAASLAKMAATKKLSKIKKSQNTNKRSDNVKKTEIKRKSRDVKSSKRKNGASNGSSVKRKPEMVSPTEATPKRRGRPRSGKPSGTPDKAEEFPKQFPAPDDGGHIVDVPTFCPTAKEFQDPLRYIASIREAAEPFGMCRVIPPASWKPECKVSDELRFTSQLQYIHKLQNRWGPNVQQMECIRKHLTSVNVDLDQPPLIGGIEVDLPKLHQTIQVFGGAQNVAERKTWLKVADAMKIPKLAQDRATKLYDAYCKYLLSYDTLSYEEKTKLEQQVRAERQKHVKSQTVPDDSVVKGKSTSLGDFTRIARNTVSMWFKDDPSPEQVESEYWKLVQDGASHVVVQCGHVDTRAQGSAFPVRRDSPCARHGWNFNVLPQNARSVLKPMGPITGVTIPTLHIGMLFTTSCWSTDLHLLPYIQFLHSGADTIWYSVPQTEERKFKTALSATAPEIVRDDSTWLQEDTVMVSPDVLSQKGLSLGRCVQSEGQFVVVFSHCHTATVSCGYSISESVHFAYPDWIPHGVSAARQLNRLAEAELFSMEGFLCNFVRESTDMEALSVALPLLKELVEAEMTKARQLIEEGVKHTSQMAVRDPVTPPGSTTKRRSIDTVEKDDCVCDVCKKICYLYMVLAEPDETVFCLDHAAVHIQKKKNLKGCQLLFRHMEEELLSLLSSTEERLAKATSGNVKATSGNVKATSGNVKVTSGNVKATSGTSTDKLSPRRRSAHLRSGTANSN